MKALIILVVGLLSVGCLTPEQKQKAFRDSVLGEYEIKKDVYTNYDFLNDFWRKTITFSK